jgi:tRNA (cytidine/uridine-2'-O-)-methyltransferase
VLKTRRLIRLLQEVEKTSDQTSCQTLRHCVHIVAHLQRQAYRMQMNISLRIALYQPDIPGNTGAIIRTAACFGLGVDIIEPAGFDLSDRALKRSGMDYVEQAAMTRHMNWEAFETWRKSEGRRLVLATTKGAAPYTEFAFSDDDILLFGRESSGVPDHVHESAGARILIPMAQGRRSLNLSVSAAVIASEAIRQLQIKS